MPSENTEQPLPEKMRLLEAAVRGMGAIETRTRGALQLNVRDSHDEAVLSLETNFSIAMCDLPYMSLLSANRIPLDTAHDVILRALSMSVVHMHANMNLRELVIVPYATEPPVITMQRARWHDRRGTTAEFSANFVRFKVALLEYGNARQITLSGTVTEQIQVLRETLLEIALAADIAVLDNTQRILKEFKSAG